MAKKKAKKSKYVSDETFAEIKESFEQALQYERGERNDLRVTRVAVPRPPRHMSSEEIVSVRKNLNYSQSVFARLLNVSVKTVQGWEQGLREPSDAALKLLAIAAKRPEVLLEV